MREDVFAYRAVAAGLRLPKIHMVINNRVTIYNFRYNFRTRQDIGKGKPIAEK